MRSCLEAIGLDPGVASVVERVFALAEVAEEEIARSKLGPSVNFLALDPGVLSSFDNAEMYRHHCQELLGRMKAGASLEPATKAEVLAILSMATLKRPSDRNSAALQEEIFAEIFPGKALEGEPTKGDWEGATSELFASLTKSFRRSGRSASRDAKEKVRRRG